MVTTLLPELVSANRVEIFRVGTHTDSQGRSREWTEADLDEAIENYNSVAASGFHEAPILHGHKGNTAFGWIKRVYREGKSLFADLKDVVVSFAARVNSRQHPKRSVSFYSPNHPHNPTPGKLNINHLAYLPAEDEVNPAIKGLTDHKFREADDDCWTYTEGTDDFGGMMMGSKTKKRCKAGDMVSWDGGKGKVKTVYTEPTTLTIAGKKVKASASEDEPYLLVTQEDDSEILVKASDLAYGESSAPTTSDHSAYMGGTFNAIASLFQSLREQTIAAKGIEEADKLYPKDAINTLARNTNDQSTFLTPKDLEPLQSQIIDMRNAFMEFVRRNPPQQNPAPTPLYSEQSTTMSDTTTSATTTTATTGTDWSAQFAEMRTQFSELQTQFTETKTQLQATQTELAASRAQVQSLTEENQRLATERERTSVVSFVEKLIAERKVLPVDKSSKIQLLLALPADTQVEFGEGDSKVNKSPRQALMDDMARGRELWSDKQMPTGPADDPNTFTESSLSDSNFDAESVRQDKKIRAYAKENGLDPNKPEEYAEAMDALGITF